MYFGTKGTLILLRERDALLFEEGGGRQTGIEVTPAGTGAVAQSSETMAANTNQAGADPPTPRLAERQPPAAIRDTPSAAAVLLGDSCRHAARVRSLKASGSARACIRANEAIKTKFRMAI